jgi:hypothetical protein
LRANNFLDIKFWNVDKMNSSEKMDFINLAKRVAVIGGQKALS